MPDFAKLDPNDLLVQNTKGNFIEMGLEAGIASMNVSRGAALVDFNLDGLVDLVVTTAGSRRRSGATSRPTPVIS